MFELNHRSAMGLRSGRGNWVNTAAPNPSGTIYTCTRLRIRAHQLIPRGDYLRMIHMSVAQIARFIGEHGYAREIHIFPGLRPDIDRIEIALAANLAAACGDVRELTTGNLKTLTDWYLHRWDIVNVMIVLRGKRRGLPTDRIREILVPAGDLDSAALEALLGAGSFENVIAELGSWRLYPVVERECRILERPCLFSELENRLWQQYYTDLIRNCGSGIPGGELFLDSLRLEIDLANFRNLLRLRAGAAGKDPSGQMIEGGNISVDELSALSRIADRDVFVSTFRTFRLHPLLVEAYRSLAAGGNVSAQEAEDYISDRWVERKRPLHEMEMAVARVRLNRMAGLSKRNPFSILPVILYLERKKYEVFNIRAIVRGIEDGVEPEKIAQYLVI
ncbi:MAG TPA: V-type ATPase subunit [Methanoregula sp.]|nr:V-type ATPase subunit [Methanoregula sp.]